MRWRVVGPILFFAVIACLPTWRFLFAGKVPAPVDQVHQSAPWNGPTPDTPWDILQLDGALQFLPWRDLCLEAMRRNEVPLWNPYTFGGQPLMANSQSAPLYPLHWIWSFTPFGAEALLSFSAWIHLFVAGLGTFFLVRRLGGSDLGGMVAGSGVAMSGFMVGWIQLPSVVMTSAWIPWCLLGIVKLNSPGVCKPRWTATLGLCGAMMLLAGHLQIAVYGLLACAVVAIWSAVASRKLVGFGLCCGSLLIAVCIASPQLLTSVMTGKLGHRAGEATAEGWVGYSRQALELRHLAVTASPYVFGMPNEPTSEGVTGYWLARSEYGKHYAELAFYVGPVILALAIAGLLRARWKQVGSIVLLAILSLSIAMGGIVAKLMYFYVPGWSATGSPGRAAVLFVMCMCVLAGVSLGDEQEERTSWMPLLVAVVVAAVGFVLMRMVQMPVGDSVFEPFISRAWSFFGLFVVGCLVAGFALVQSKYQKSLVGTALLLSVIGLFAAHINMNPGSDKGRFVERFDGIESLQGKRVAVMNSDWSFFVSAPSVIAPPNSLLPYRITEIAGYDSIIPRTTKKKIDDANGKDSAPEVNGNIQFVKPGVDLGQLAALGAEILISKESLSLEREYEGAGWTAYKIPNPAPQLLTASFSKISYSPGSSPDITDLVALGWRDVGERSLEYRPAPYIAGVFGLMLGIFAVFLLYCASWSKVE
ncbi:MAG: hypothetical protein U0R49_09555 [Fimbriimonadales bacterium]